MTKQCIFYVKNLIRPLMQTVVLFHLCHTRLSHIDVSCDLNSYIPSLLNICLDKHRLSRK